MIKHSLQRILRSALCLVVGISCLTGCGSSKTYDDIITNEGYDIHQDESDSDSTSYIGTAIPKEDLKVGVIHLTDPAEGSGYTYTHDLGIQGMQDNLGLSSDQIIRKINVDDSNEDETRQAI